MTAQSSLAVWEQTLELKGSYMLPFLEATRFFFSYQAHLNHSRKDFRPRLSDVPRAIFDAGKRVNRMAMPWAPGLRFKEPCYLFVAGTDYLTE